MMNHSKSLRAVVPSATAAGIGSCSRRSFLAGVSAFSLSGCLAPGGVLASRPRVKFGVISDIHITDWDSAVVFRKTLRYFRDQDVDAVMIVGDMADHGLLPQLENVSRAWYETFPDDRGLNGRHVEKLFVYGNHDPEGLRYRDAAMDKAFAVHHLSYEEAEKLTMPVQGLARCWDRCFHEEYRPIYRKNVNGYDFIGGHWDRWDGIRGLEDWFKANIGAVNTSQPFFYFQHCTPRNTIYGADSWGDDAGQSVRALSPYANAVAFSGHSHRSLTDKRSYWRGEFTSIGTSTLSYVCLPDGRANRPNYRDRLDCRQGQVVSVYDDYFAILRRDFIRDEDLDEVLTFEMPAKPSTFPVRAVSRSEIPAFAAGAKLSLAVKADELALTIPGAFANPTARPFEYGLDFRFAVPSGKGGEKTVRLTRSVFQTNAALSRKRAESAVTEFRLPKGKWPKGALRVNVSVQARNSFGGPGGTLSASARVCEHS